MCRFDSGTSGVDGTYRRQTIRVRSDGCMVTGAAEQKHSSIRVAGHRSDAHLTCRAVFLRMTAFAAVANDSASTALVPAGERHEAGNLRLRRRGQGYSRKGMCEHRTDIRMRLTIIDSFQPFTLHDGGEGQSSRALSRSAISVENKTSPVFFAASRAKLITRLLRRAQAAKGTSATRAQARFFAKRTVDDETDYSSQAYLVFVKQSCDLTASSSLSEYPRSQSQSISRGAPITSTSPKIQPRGPSPRFPSGSDLGFIFFENPIQL